MNEGETGISKKPRINICCVKAKNNRNDWEDKRKLTNLNDVSNTGKKHNT